jgi:regulatory protein
MPTFSEALVKAASFCAYQERTQREVREKLHGWGVDTDTTEEVIAELISQNYLSEERFAKAYAGGKFRVKQWGRLKIRYELKMRGLSDYVIMKGLAEIPDQDYEETIEDLLQKKLRELRSQPSLVQKQKATRFVIGKGFEAEEVFRIYQKINNK